MVTTLPTSAVQVPSSPATPTSSAPVDCSLEHLLQAVIHMGGSDLIMRAGETPRVRVNSIPKPLKVAPWTTERMLEELGQVLPESSQDHYTIEHREADFAVTAGDRRFRAHAFWSMKTPGLVCRLIPESTSTIAELGLPDVITRFAKEHRGLLVVTGPTGSGKTTTLNGIIARINKTRACHIVTIEDPVEQVHVSDRAVITQREIGSDTRDFDTALRALMREDPDVVLLGELRDAETARAALQAAETGHFVLSTMHTSDAPETVNRFLDLFEAEERDHVRGALAANLKGVVAQRLIPTADGTSRVPACEVLVNTSSISDAIVRPDEGATITERMSVDSMNGMQTFAESLLALVKEGRISVDAAMANATNPNDMGLLLRQNGYATDRLR